MNDPANLLAEAFCKSVQIKRLGGGVREVVTPLLDWSGHPVSVFVTPEGMVTDGGGTLNELRSLRVYDDWAEWTWQNDFLNRYAIAETDGELVAKADSTEGLLRYVQGIARLPAYFEHSVIRARADMFPLVVKERVKPLLISAAPPTAVPLEWAESRLQPRRWQFKKVRFNTDLNPVDPNLMVQVIANASANDSAKRQHVSAKVLPYEYAVRRDHPVKLVIVVNNLTEYPEDSRDLLEQDAAQILDWARDEVSNDLARVLGVSTYRAHKNSTDTRE